MDELFRKPVSKKQKVVCPVDQCSTPIWNTPRYFNKTRERAYKVTEAEAERRKKQVETEKIARQDAASGSAVNSKHSLHLIHYQHNIYVVATLATL